MEEEIKLDAVISKLSHDLKNHFILIRAAAGIIKKHSPHSDIIEKKVMIINQALDQAIASLQEAYASALLVSTGSDGHEVK